MFRPTSLELWVGFDSVLTHPRADALLRTLGLVEDGDIQPKVLALHQEPNATVNVDCT